MLGIRRRGVPLAAEKKSFAGRAVGNVAKRIQDEPVPLFDGVLPRGKRMKFYGDLT